MKSRHPLLNGFGKRINCPARWRRKQARCESNRARSRERRVILVVAIAAQVFPATHSRSPVFLRGEPFHR